MRIKKYEAPSMKEALARVKAELGPEAVILNTRKFRPGGSLNFLAKDVFEVTAAIDVNLLDYQTKPRPEPYDPGSPQAPAPLTISAPPPDGSADKLKTLESEIDEVKAIVRSIARQLDDPLRNAHDNLAIAYHALLESYVGDRLAKDLVRYVREQLTQEGLADPERVRQALCGRVSQMINASGPLSVSGEERKVVALIGPTGTGKTTTIAKLAAQFSLLKNKKVCLITADTYRIAAVDQLKTYAEIIGVPIEVVFSSQEMREALERHKDKDLVLVDTVGRSPDNTMHLRELTELLGSYAESEVHLVLSATTKLSDQMNSINRFSPAKVDKLIFTKLDETTSPGSILSILADVDIGISYITTGQNVPDDIEVAQPQKIAQMIVGEITDDRSSKEASRAS